MAELLTAAPPAEAEPRAVPHHRVAIVGAGFAGLGAAIALRQAGISDFVVLERGDDVGGTWRDNTYPGCACDVPSNLYSFSFAQNPDWTRFFPRQPEILEYLRRTATRFGVRPHLRLRTEVRGARWDEGRGRWSVSTGSGDLTADFLVVGDGALSRPWMPAVPGLDTFRGAAFHSARWDHGVDLTGKRVAVVGTGASAVQIVPELQKVVDQLYVVQRTPAWIRPRLDRPLSRQHTAVFRRLPAAQTAVRVALYWVLELLGMGFTLNQRLLRPIEAEARRHLRRQVPDPELRAKLTPTCRIGCKRILYSNEFYPALQRPNVELLAGALRELRPGSLVTADGQEREVDVVVFATGFSVTQRPLARRVVGRGGRTLADAWADGMHAYLGTAVSGFPNCFLLVGPNTGLGHTSMILMIESQVAYLVDCLRQMGRRGATTVEVRPEVERAFTSEVRGRLGRTVWTSGGCTSWYLDDKGRNTTLWPASTWRFRLRTRRFDPADYLLGQPAGEPAAPPAAAGR